MEAKRRALRIFPREMIFGGLFGLLLLLACWGALAYRSGQADAERKNDRQASELLDAAIQLDLPGNMEPKRIEVCHLPLTGKTWETYVFITVEAQSTYQELAAQLEEQPVCLSHETTPFKVLAFDTYLADPPYDGALAVADHGNRPDCENLFVLYCIAPVSDARDRRLALETGPCAVWTA